MILRVFPRRTNATPDDKNVRIKSCPTWFDEADAVHVSVTFTWDLPRAEQLAAQWERVAPVTIGGPATGERGEDFEPGMYLRHGYTITSRGCPNHCWFCDVWRREGAIRELPIREGRNVLDDNLLACSESHIRAVFTMLRKVKSDQPGRRVEFTGGLEAARLEPWHVDELLTVKPKQMFFAYDTPDDLEPLQRAGKMLLDAGWTRASKTLRCYVLCGHPQDSFEAASHRMQETLDAGLWPMAMLYRDRDGKVDLDWRRFQRRWARPAIMSHSEA